MYVVECIAMFALTYLASILTITVGYHRGLAHRALTLNPFFRGIVIHGGWWLTGLDPKAWVVMHRMHHVHSDVEGDPHRPRNGLWGMIVDQYHGMARTIGGLRRNQPQYTRHAKDLTFHMNPLLVRGLWLVPYAVHGVVAVVLCATVGVMFGIAYYLGITSHPLQGALVNYLGHMHGGRNFDTQDNSRNNLFAAWFIFGEGFQNNHHRYPRSARFDYRRAELDLGYVACVVFDKLRLIEINRPRLMPRAAASGSSSSRGQEVDDDDQQNEADATAAVVTNAGTGPVTTTAEEQEQDQEYYY